MSNNTASDFPSFDELLDMANNRPEALEAFRQQQIEQLINNAPAENRRRLQGLQFQIDAQLKIHCDSPLGSCMKINQMMHESFAELRLCLNDVSGIKDPLQADLDAYEVPEQKNAKVLPFPAN